MKIKLSFKDPEAMGGIVESFMLKKLWGTGRYSDNGLDKMDVYEIAEIFEKEFGISVDTIEDAIGKFVEYDEYVMIEVDIVEGTATVVPNKEGD